MNKKYFDKIIYEMKQAYGIKDENMKKKNLMNELKQWISEKREAAEYFSYFYDYMKDTDNKEMFKIVELGAGIYDSIVPSMLQQKNHKPVIISEYADTFDKLELPIEKYNGILSVNDNKEPYILYKNQKGNSVNPNCLPIFKDDIETFITSLSNQNGDFLTSKAFLPYLYFALNENNNKTFLIGAYGSKYDKNKESNIKYLKLLSDFFKNLDTKKVSFAYETEKDSYLSGVMIEPDINKNLKKLIKK